MTGVNIKLPPGMSPGDAVVSNNHYAIVHPRAPRRRKGEIVAGTSKPNSVRVRWQGCTYDHEVNAKLFDVVKKESAPCSDSPPIIASSAETANSKRAGARGRRNRHGRRNKRSDGFVTVTAS